MLLWWRYYYVIKQNYPYGFRWSQNNKTNKQTKIDHNLWIPPFILSPVTVFSQPSTHSCILYFMDNPKGQWLDCDLKETNSVRRLPQMKWLNTSAIYTFDIAVWSLHNKYSCIYLQPNQISTHQPAKNMSFIYSFGPQCETSAIFPCTVLWQCIIAAHKKSDIISLLWRKYNSICSTCNLPTNLLLIRRTKLSGKENCFHNCFIQSCSYCLSKDQGMCVCTHMRQVHAYVHMQQYHVHFTVILIK